MVMGLGVGKSTGVGRVGGALSRPDARDQNPNQTKTQSEVR